MIPNILHLRYRLEQSHTTPHTHNVPDYGNLQLLRSIRDIKDPRLVSNKVFSLTDIPSPSEFTKANNIKIIHAHHGNLGVLLLDFQKKSKVPMVTGFRGKCATIKDQPQAYIDQLPKLFRTCERFFPVCNYLADRIVELGCPSEKIRVLYGGIDLRKFQYSPSNPKDTRNILAVGRLVEKKGHHTLMKAFSKLRKKYPNATLTIVGSGIYKENILSLASQLHLGSSFRLMDKVHYDKIPNLMHKADIFCAPSLTGKDGDVEGIPNTLKEAMATGLPVISTYHAGIPELVTNEKNGLLVRENNVDKLALALDYMLSHPDQWEKFGSEARKTIENKFNLNKQLKLQSSYYDEILKK